MSSTTTTTSSAKTTETTSKKLTLLNVCNSFTSSVREGKIHFSKQLTWVPDKSVSKKIPTWASNPEKICKLISFMRLIKTKEPSALEVKTERKIFDKHIELSLKDINRLKERYDKEKLASSASTAALTPTGAASAGLKKASPPLSLPKSPFQPASPKK